MQTYFQTQAIGENKRTRTRNALIDSAIDVFSTHGMEQARISEITARAGLANGTFYNHFRDKDELAAATASAIAFEIAKRLDDAMAGVTRAASRIVVASSRFLSIAIDNPAWASVLVAQYVRAGSFDGGAVRYLRADVALGIEQGLFDVTLDDFLLQEIGALMITALRRQLRNDDNAACSRRACEGILRLLGLSPARARQEISKASPVLEALAA